ncbi:MAG: hypothetical protein ACFFD4_23110 [Candidatus Odinarchaeota archaeon]
MDGKKLTFFLEEIDFQAKNALKALDGLDRLIPEYFALWDGRSSTQGTGPRPEFAKKREEVNEKIDDCSTRIWLTIQSFLAATANLSKIF